LVESAEGAEPVPVGYEIEIERPESGEFCGMLTYVAVIKNG